MAVENGNADFFNRLVLYKPASSKVFGTISSVYDRKISETGND